MQDKWNDCRLYHRPERICLLTFIQRTKGSGILRKPRLVQSSFFSDIMPLWPPCEARSRLRRNQVVLCHASSCRSVIGSQSIPCTQWTSEREQPMFLLLILYDWDEYRKPRQARKLIIMITLKHIQAFKNSGRPLKLRRRIQADFGGICFNLVSALARDHILISLLYHLDMRSG